MRIHLICTVCVETINTRVDIRGRTYIPRTCQKCESVSLHDLLSTGRHLLGVSFKTSLKTNLRIVLTTYNTTENKCITSNAQNTTAFQPSVFLAGIHQSLVANKCRSDFPRANNCQGRQQIPVRLIALSNTGRMGLRGFLLLYFVQFSLLTA
jgi:hypothetical protein